MTATDPRYRMPVAAFMDEAFGTGAVTVVCSDGSMWTWMHRAGWELRAAVPGTLAAAAAEAGFTERLSPSEPRTLASDLAEDR